MPKPTDGVPNWATDTLFVGGPEDGFNTKTVPAEPAQGWRPNSIPGCEVQNWWQNLVGKWFAWVNAFFVIDGSDNLTIPAGLVVTGTTTANDTVTLAANKSVVVSGTGMHKHGDKVRMFPGTAAVYITDGGVSPGTISTNVVYPSSGYKAAVQTGAAVNLHWPLTFDVGERVKSVTWRIQGDGAVDITAADVDYVDNAGTAHALGSTTLSNVSSSMQDLTINITDHTMAAGETLFAELIVNAASLMVYSVAVTYDRP